MNGPNFDANIITFFRVLKKLGLLTKATYFAIGQDLMLNGNSKKDAWRKANWKEFLKSG